MDLQPGYRQLQSIWSRASDLLGQRRHGLAVRLLREGIHLAERPGHEDSHRLYQMKRDLAGALADLGEFDEAIALYEQIGRLDAVGRILLTLGRDEEAVQAYERAVREPLVPYFVFFRLGRALSLICRRGSSLEAYIRGLREAPHLGPKPELGKLDCILTLAGLESRYGMEGLRARRAEIETEYRCLYRTIVQNYGNWRSAIVHLEANLREGRLQSIAERLRPRRDDLGWLELDYEESEVDRVLSLSQCVDDKWQRLMSSLELAQSGDFETARERILAICGEDPDSHVAHSGRTCFRDLLILEGRFEEALNWRKEDFTGSSWDWNIYLNLLLLSGRKLSGRELAEHYGWLLDQATPFLTRHREEFAAFCQRQLDTFELREGTDLLAWTARRYGQGHMGSWGLFVGAASLGSSVIRKSPFAKYEDSMIYFYSIDEMHVAIRGLLAEAENQIRDSLGVPRIGEGWVREAEMVTQLRKCLAPFPVLAQGSPRWLGGLRYDAYVPGLHLAVEYQGKQHFEAVEWFGGEQGLADIQNRDRRKALLSRANGVHLEYVRYDEDLRQRLDELAAAYLPRTTLQLPRLQERD